MSTRWGMTVPLGGVALADHAAVFAALARDSQLWWPGRRGACLGVEAAETLEHLVHNSTGRLVAPTQPGEAIKALTAVEETTRSAMHEMRQVLTVLRADAFMDLAEVLRTAGRENESPPFVERAVELYEQKGNVVAAGRARRILDA
jgi:hypothetical protein